jgi:Protein of unknown function (DUF732)
MRDRETIDAELRRIASMRRSIREQGGQPSYKEVDELLDERLGHRVEPSENEAARACETGVVASAARDLGIDDVTSRRLKAVRRRRFGPFMALPLSLLAVAAALVMMFVVHRPAPVAEPAVIPPTAAPSAAPSKPVAPQAPAPPPVDIVDMAFMGALKHDGVPIPDQEYVMTHGHAVCDFMAHQPNFAGAVDFVQRSTIWDAAQSASFTAGAIVSYCPQYQAASTDQMQQTYQNALSDLQAIQGNLQGIQGNLQGIRDGLPAIPGHQ